LDAVTRSSAVPFSAVTRLVPEAAGILQAAEQVQYSAVLTACSPLREVLAALKYRAYGFRHCKLKVGSAARDDAATVRRIRRAMGRHVDLRLDANAGWTREQTLRLGECLRTQRVSAVEQPLPHEHRRSLRAIRKELGVPIVLDESLCSMSDAREAIALEACDVFNIRLSKCGGFLPSLRLAAAAGRAGLGYQLGCQVGETGILSAAGRHFATSVAHIRYLEGSYDRHLVTERLTVQDLTFGYGGVAQAINRPGLGIDIDEAAVKRVTRRTLTIPISIRRPRRSERTSLPPDGSPQAARIEA
ncbi:MAG: mandelate racemase/muconate lactonizing enzyme family protein, partial [Planctomycetaceae bacterium]